MVAFSARRWETPQLRHHGPTRNYRGFNRLDRVVERSDEVDDAPLLVQGRKRNRKLRHEFHAGPRHARSSTGSIGKGDGLWCLKYETEIATDNPVC